jgi:hypothetical protein
LNKGLVHNGQDFLGHGFGGWQEAGAVAGNREETLLDQTVRPYFVSVTACLKSVVRVG